MSFLRKQTIQSIANASLLFLLALGCLFAPLATFAASPSNIINYQGRILDSNGTPVADTTINMEFRFYTALTGGTCVWSNSSSDCDGNTPASTVARSVTLTSGLLSEALGDIAATTPYAAIASSTFADNSAIYLEVEIAGEALSPRKQMVATPYALNAQTLDGYDSSALLLKAGDTATGVFTFQQTVDIDGGANISDVTAGANVTMGNSTGNLTFLSDNADITLTDATDNVFQILGSGGATLFDIDLGASDAITLGDNSTTIAINSSDWDVSVTGDMTGIGVITMNGLLTGTLGATLSGATISLNASSNFNTNINTGTSTGTVTIGGSAGNTINIGSDNTVADTIGIGSVLDQLALIGDDWSVTSAGLITTASDLAVNGDDVTADGSLTLNATGYLRVGDAGTPGVANGDDDLYVESDIELDGDLYLQGDDLFMNTNTNGFILVADGTNFNPVDLSGDADISTLGVVSISADAVTLGTDTSGNYIATLADAGGSDFTIQGSGSEAAAVTIDITSDAIDFDEIADAATLDAATSITGAAGRVFSFIRTFTDATAENSVLISTTASDVAGSTTSQYGLYLDNLASTEALDASLVIDNSDADDAIAAALLFIDAGGGFTNLIDSTEFDVSGTTGSITIDDGGNMGQVSVEGTVMDINSLDFTGAGVITSGSNTNVGVTPGGSGDLVMNVDADSHLIFSADADTSVDIGTSSNENLYIFPTGTGDTAFGVDDDSSVKMSLSGNTGAMTFIQANYPSAVTLDAGASIVGFALDLSTNLTLDAGGNGQTGMNIIVNSGGSGTTKGLDIDGSPDVDVDLSAGEAILNRTNGSIEFLGIGGTNDAGIVFDLDGLVNATPTISASITDSLTIYDNLLIGVDGDTSESIDDGGFVFSGNDLYVADMLGVNGNAYVDGTFYGVGASLTADLAVNGDDITADGSLTLNATGYLRVGDTGTPDSVNGDDDLYVESDIELDGDLYLQGDDLFMNTNTNGFILVADGTNFNPVDLSGDADISTLGVVSISADAVTLGTDTSGNYIATLADAGGSDFTIQGSGSEAAAVTIDITSDAIDFDEIADAATLDAATSITGAAGRVFSFIRTFTDATAENSVLISTTASDVAGSTTSQYGLYLDNLASTEALDASLVIDNSDADDAIAAALLFIDAGGGFTNLIDSTEFDVSGTTGSITIDDGGNMGQVSVEGTVMDIDSLTFVAAGEIAAAGALDLDPVGNLTVTLADGESMLVDADTSPTTDILVLGTGDTSVTDNVDILSIISTITNANGAGLRFTPSYSTDVAKTVSIIGIDAFTATASDGNGDDAGKDLTLSGLNVGTLTESELFNEEVLSAAIRIADGWDSLFKTTDATANIVIPVGGVLTFKDANAYSLMTLTADGTFNTGSLALTGGLTTAGDTDFNFVTGSSSNTENFTITQTHATDQTLSVIDLTFTDTAATDVGENYLLKMTNADDGTLVGNPDAFIYLNHLDGNEVVSSGIYINVDGNNMMTNGLDVSDSGIVNALNIGANAIVGTYFDVAEATGAVTLTQQAVGTSPFTVTGLAASTASIMDLNVESAGGSIIDIDWTSETATAAVNGIDVDMTNLTGDGSTTVYGFHVNDPAAATAATEYGIYQQGTNWDYGLYVEDDAYFGNGVTFGGAITWDSFDLTPSSNIDAIDITGTNMTSASAIDMDMINTSGNIIDLSLAPTVAGASTAQGMTIAANPATGATVSGDLLELTMDGVDASSFTGDGLKIVVDKSQNTGRPIRIEDDVAALIFMVEENGNVTLAGTHIDGSGALTVDSGGGTLQLNASGGTLSLDSSTGTIETNASTFTADNSLSINTVLTGGITIDSGTTGTVNVGIGNNAKIINIGTGTAGNTINIGTNNTTADTIYFGSALDTLSLIGSTSSLIDFPNFDVAATTGAMTLTRQAVGTSPLTITGLADSTVADLDINTSLNQGTIIDVDYSGAETIAAALTGMSLNLRTNVTGATGVNVTGHDVNMPALTSTSSTTYTGYDISISGAMTHSTAGVLSWRGFHVQMPNITQTSGTLQSSGLLVETGSITTGGTQNGVDIFASGVGAGSLNGINIGSITAGAGTESAINIAAGWDIDIDLQNGETIDNATDGTIALRDGNTALISASLTTLQFNLDDTITYTQRLCHSGADTFTGLANVGDCNVAGQADYAEIYPMATDVSYGDIVVTGSTSVITEHGEAMVQLVKSSNDYQNQLLGVAVDNWEDGSSIGYNIADTDNPMPVALVGRVMVHVNDENGAIAVGDPITSSSAAGYGMKATEPGTIIGFALDTYMGSGIGEIMVYVNPIWYAGNVVSTDGSSTYIADETILASLGEADAANPTYASYGLALRGSAWDGSVAQSVDMKIMNDVTDADHYRLSIRNVADTEVAYITNEGTLSIAGDLMIAGRLYPSDRGTAQSDKYIYYDGSSGAGGDFMRTNASGWATGSYDFAEMFPSDEILISGDVVVFAGDGAKVRRATSAEGDQLAGIVSTRPGFLAGENEAGSYPIALAGRVPTKVTMEGGVIEVGDPLTISSTAGYAKKATEPGMVVGYALEPYEGAEGQDESVITFVNIGYFDGGETFAANVYNTASGSDIQNLSNLSMSGSLSMSGYDVTAIGRLAGLGDVWSIEMDGTVKTQATLQTVISSYQNEWVTTTAVTSPQTMITLSGSGRTQLGSAIILFEESDPTFNDVISATAPLYVIVTPNAPVRLYVSSKDQNGFIVQTAQEDPDTTFDWMVTAYRKDYEPVEVMEEPMVEEIATVEVMEEPMVEEIATDEIITEEVPQEIIETEVPTEVLQEETVAEEDPASSESPIEIIIDEFAPISEGDITVEQPL